MGKERGHARLCDRSHVVEFFFLALERGTQKPVHLDARRSLSSSRDAQHDPVSEVKDDHAGQ